ETRRNEELVSGEDASRTERRRDHREVLARPLERAEHRPRRLADADLHRGSSEQARGDEMRVCDSSGRRRRLVDEGPQPYAQGGEIEDGIDDTGDDRALPDAAVVREPELVRAERERRRGHSSTSVRPVRWRKTSSSVERRTRML